MTTGENDNGLVRTTEENTNELPLVTVEPIKRRKRKSIVWEHFTIETVSPECRRACCNQCKQSFAYSTGSKVAGTSHLMRHIAKGTCLALLRHPGGQPSPGLFGNGTVSEPVKRRRSSRASYSSFDPNHCRREMARMIIMHDYPLHMVEHRGFLNFVNTIQPRFDSMSFNSVRGDCVATFLSEKKDIMKFIERMPGHVCLTLDLWTSSQGLGYVFLTGHFIDSAWKPHRRILNVVMEPYLNSDSILSHAVACCLSHWNLEGKLFSITQNHPVGKPGLENLRSLFCIKNPQILNGQLLIRHCIARTLSSIAKDILSAGQEIVKKIRDSVKYVKTSESHEEKFLELTQQLQVPSERSLILDDQTQWNTTYQMLMAASELKEVFSCLDASDPHYKEPPSMEIWKQVETICTYLKPLFDTACILTPAGNAPAITLFHEVWKLQMDSARAFTSDDPFAHSLAKPMHEKIGTYWKDCSLVLAMAVVMDPRFKMKLIEFSFSKIYGDDAPAYIKIVDDGIHELFLEYLALPPPAVPTYGEEGNGNAENMKTEEQQGCPASDTGYTDFDAYIIQTTTQPTKPELDQYLEESLLPRQGEFDVLGWWKLNQMKFPTLSRMARDILTIPVCTAAQDSIFDIAPKELDSYHSSLRPETVEALFCAKDWLQYRSPETSPVAVKVEKIEY